MNVALRSVINTAEPNGTDNPNNEIKNEHATTNSDTTDVRDNRTSINENKRTDIDDIANDSDTVDGGDKSDTIDRGAIEN